MMINMLVVVPNERICKFEDGEICPYHCEKNGKTFCLGWPWGVNLYSEIVNFEKTSDCFRVSKRENERLSRL